MSNFWQDNTYFYLYFLYYVHTVIVFFMFYFWSGIKLSIFSGTFLLLCFYSMSIFPFVPVNFWHSNLIFPIKFSCFKKDVAMYLASSSLKDLNLILLFPSRTIKIQPISLILLDVPQYLWITSSSLLNLLHDENEERKIKCILNDQKEFNSYNITCFGEYFTFSLILF